MTRKDYVVVALAFQLERSEDRKRQKDHSDWKTLNRLAERLADQFEQDNSRFNRETFLAACGNAQ